MSKGLACYTRCYAQQQSVTLAEVGEPTAPSVDRDRLTAAINAGYRTCMERGDQNPRLADVVWVLLREAAWVTAAVPDADRRFQLGLRSNWPRVLVTAADVLDARFARVGSGVDIQQEGNRSGPTPEQISRAELVMTWWQAVRVDGRRVDRRTVTLAAYLLASGVKASLLARQFGVSRMQIYRWRDMAIAQIAGWLENFFKWG